MDAACCAGLSAALVAESTRTTTPPTQRRRLLAPTPNSCDCRSRGARVGGGTPTSSEPALRPGRFTAGREWLAPILELRADQRARTREDRSDACWHQQHARFREPSLRLQKTPKGCPTSHSAPVPAGDRRGDEGTEIQVVGWFPPRPAIPRRLLQEGVGYDELNARFAEDLSADETHRRGSLTLRGRDAGPDRSAARGPRRGSGTRRAARHAEACREAPPVPDEWIRGGSVTPRRSSTAGSPSSK